MRDGDTYGTMEEFKEALGRGMGEEERWYEGAGGKRWQSSLDMIVTEIDGKYGGRGTWGTEEEIDV